MYYDNCNQHSHSIYITPYQLNHPCKPHKAQRQGQKWPSPSWKGSPRHCHDVNVIKTEVTLKFTGLRCIKMHV